MNVMTSNLPQPIPSDSELVARCLVGETAAFTMLIDRHRARLERLLHVLLHNRTEMDDVWQETLLRAYFNLEQLRDPARFGAWLYSIAINLARTYRSANTPKIISWEDLGTSVTELSDGQQSPDLLLIQKEMLKQVRQAIADLPPAERETVLLVYLEGLSHKEVAAQLGSSLSAVKVRVHRGRRRLQVALQEEFGQSLHQKERKRKMIAVMVHDILRATKKEEQAKQETEAEGTFGQTDPNLLRIVLLKEMNGERVLSIWIGPAEGDFLAMHLLQQEAKRPMTYDLLRTLLTLGDMTMEQAVIARLHENTYYSNLTVKTPTTTAEVDCRPSDAINLAVRLGVPIFVAEEVMDQAGKPLDAPQGYVWESLLHANKS
jgi:RNA polymerase sigma factor (sigma-70 family)